MSRFIASALFDHEAEADRAIRDLRVAGVPDSALSIIAQHDGKNTTTDGEGNPHDEPDGRLVRGLVGGGALGAGLAVAALAIPGVGPLVAAGAVATTLLPEALAIGAAAGAAAGALNEDLGKHGVSDDDARYYHEGLSGGATLVAVDDSATGVDSDQVRDILHRHGGHSASRARMTTNV